MILPLSSPKHDEGPKGHREDDRSRQITVPRYAGVCGPHGVEHGQRLLQDVVGVDAELLQQRRLVLEAGWFVGVVVGGGVGGVGDEHGAGVVRLLGQVGHLPAALVVAAHSAAAAAIVKLLEVSSLLQEHDILFKTHFKTFDFKLTQKNK